MTDLFGACVMCTQYTRSSGEHVALARRSRASAPTEDAREDASIERTTCNSQTRTRTSKQKNPWDTSTRSDRSLTVLLLEDEIAVTHPRGGQVPRHRLECAVRGGWKIHHRLRRRASDVCLDPCERRLDGVVLGAIRGKEYQLDAVLVEHLRQRPSTVERRVVHDDGNLPKGYFSRSSGAA